LNERFRVVHDLDEPLIAQLHSLYQGEWWSNARSLEDTRRCVRGSQVCVALVAGDRLVAFARVLTDYIFKAMIFDVIVVRDQRGQSLGNAIIERVLKHERLRDVRHFELYCLPEMFAFYRRHGFTEDVGAVRLMRRTTSA
jgi:GNAT superfamily N-acetyltransferase